ncbi:hypothetical protein THAOC_05883 [Thalassiosira oceanica]|uniref:UV excision repair protein RAD23 n=1 Tax=Thalassiosira oceanica TaxID=159749 RepID=K0T4F8_THAOC|nr:hypothetical protein THAOC_05883 [Thalassiosira oceanica]|eukprot:EJK72575.1 hypothetical protein THAOC_05883 [Thalassiosira oceanica]
MINLTVKTLKGGKFTIEVDPSNSVAEVKAVIRGGGDHAHDPEEVVAGNFLNSSWRSSNSKIQTGLNSEMRLAPTRSHALLFRQENTKSELPAAGMKLIHSGKVLKDDEKIESCNIKPNDFLVVMIAKAKKAAAPKPAAAATAPKTPAATATTSTPSAPAPASSGGTTAAAASAAPAVPARKSALCFWMNIQNEISTVSLPKRTLADTAAASAAATSSPAAAPAGGGAAEFPAEVVNNLKALGFPDEMVVACLRASNGNPDVAVEFLMNGIPPGIGGGAPAAAPAAPAAPSASSSGGGGGGGPLAALRNHPQFDSLRRLVQSNPNALQQVLAQIGQQQPELLQAINANQQEFLAMMNEPVAEAPAGGGADAGGADAGHDGADDGRRRRAAPGHRAGHRGHAAGATRTALTDGRRGHGAGGMPPGMMGGGGEGGPQVLRLSEEEMAAVNRLTEMGFDRTEAAQAYLACDKNEALAANLLMDGGFGGGAFGGDDGGGDGDGQDDMYD